MNGKNKFYWFGVLAEFHVILVFLKDGYRLIRHRYKTGAGEIDLILAKGNSLVAVEVKARVYNGANIGEIVSHRQFRRIMECLKIFLNKYEEYSNFDIRIDVVLVYKNFLIEHIENAWMEQE